ncbi:hypothetical protein [Nostoc linckia]|nr:hypothetical protein [Nostoc linckia]
MGRWGDGGMGRWGAKENIIPQSTVNSQQSTYPIIKNATKFFEHN